MNPAPHAAALKKLARTFQEKAAALVQSCAPEASLFSGEDGHEWLMDQIEQAMQQDEWSNDDAAKLAAAFFFLLTCPEDEPEEENAAASDWF